MTHQEILNALEKLEVEKLDPSAAKAEMLYREAIARIRDHKASYLRRQTSKRYMECWVDAQNEMAVKVTDILEVPGVFSYEKHLDDKYYPVAYTVAAVLYENGVRV